MASGVMAKKKTAVKRKKAKAKTLAAPRRTRKRPTVLKTIYTATGPQVVNLGYKAATEIRRSGRGVNQGGSGDFHLQYDLPTLRAESQSFDRDNGIFQGLIDRGLDNILGSGISMQARTKSKSVNKKLESLWAAFGMDPEVRGLDDWTDLERLVMRQLWVDGDVGGIKTNSGQVQIIESERIANLSKGNYTGIEMTALGRPTRYWVAGYTPTGMVSSKSKMIPAKDFVFVANRLRSSQTRGIPVMTSNMPMIHRINDVLDSEAISWQILARLAVAIYQRDAAEKSFNSSTENTDAEDRDISQRYNDIGEAIIFHGEPGEEIKGIERNIPGTNFPKSIEVYMRMMGLPLGMPLELVMLDWSKTNYSSARAALEQAYRMFKRWQRLLIRRWHEPIYRWKVQSWIDAELISMRDDIFKAEWFPPPFPWIDPLKEAQAKGESVDRGFGTYTDVLRGQNLDRQDVIAQREQEILDAIAKAEEVQKKTGQVIPWELFAGFDPAKTTPTPIEPDDKPKPATQGDDDDDDK